ncbi:GxGYxYP domain-containing protein [Parapedobacter koreensis]|uniref:GxGYxY sequence motif-containing protein n=1 Tax=Parapedobacter koreensis TaxID=332977 RepID=A0A1H7PWY1_9SPHI|nr:GxGYxYP domain-containing protein [Parapedobacter koreensis]SEL40242.1 GxGYxY sequence motif-containing protein [Parapedobacter koreensis]
MKLNTMLFKTIILLLGTHVAGCNKYTSPEINQGLDEQLPGLYEELYDPIADNGQYNLLEMTVKPARYWNCVEVLNVGSRNNIGESEEIRGLQYHLLCQSLAGLANRAVQDGRSQVGVWLHDHAGRASYSLSKQALSDMGISEQGMQSGIELARNNYGPSDGIALQLKDLFEGYVLTDVTNNPESNTVASVASSVYNAIIVDVRDQANYDQAGYKMVYDATTKTTADAWNEFKDRVSNKALVVMPVQTGELRDFAIMHNLFVLNVNKAYNNPAAGQNLPLFEEILQWLEPGAPIYGWEQGVDEEVFVNRASITGHVWVPNDWMYNLPLTSLAYRERQEQTLAQVTNPQFIDWEKDKKFVSFYLTDGDNIQWMMNDFVGEYYQNADVSDVKMGFGVPVSNLTQIAPAQFNRIMGLQNREATVIEALGGGYQYVDNFGRENNREARLAEVAGRVASSMRQHRVKLLGLMAKDAKSADAQEGYQAFIDANDQLEGIVVLQYAPYAGGGGEIFWLRNSAGYDIPVVTVSYSLWNFGSQNHEREGTPAYIAQQLAQQATSDFSIVAVHAWSAFRDTGNSTDLLGENSDGDLRGASAAKLVKKHLGDDFEVVNPQELIWRIRKQYKPEQTEQYLNTYY